MTPMLFQDLDKNKIPYAVWKDINNIDEFIIGNGELDILADEADQDAFEKIVNDNGFANLKVHEFLRKDGIEHYIKYQGGKYYHLHVYYRLITGNHYVKEYQFDIDKGIFDRVTKINGINVVSHHDELALLLLRTTIKQSLFFSSIKQSETTRVNELANEVDLVEVSSLLSYYAPDLKPKTKELIDASSGKRVLLAKRLALKKQFSNNRNRSSIRFYFDYLSIRCYLLMLRILRRSNKTLPKTGCSIAVLGTDGSGKSTIVDNLSTMFSAKTSAKTIYLGGNSKTYSLMTRCYYCCYKALRVFSPLKDRYYFAWFLYHLGLCSLEYGKAKDREKRVKKGVTLRKNGWVVIYERFPIVGLFDFPNKLYILKSCAWRGRYGVKFIDFILDRIKKIIESLPEPDMTFILTVDFDKMRQRRKMSKNEVYDIRGKLFTQSKFLMQSTKDICIVDNNDDFDYAIALITDSVNNKICKYN